MRLTVRLADTMWLWQADGVWHLGRAPDEWPGARVPRPQVLQEGTEVDIEVWHAGCAGCAGCAWLRRAQDFYNSDEAQLVEHTHGRP